MRSCHIKGVESRIILTDSEQKCTVRDVWNPFNQSAELTRTGTEAKVERRYHNNWIYR